MSPEVYVRSGYRGAITLGDIPLRELSFPQGLMTEEEEKLLSDRKLTLAGGLLMLMTLAPTLFLRFEDVSLSLSS